MLLAIAENRVHHELWHVVDIDKPTAGRMALRRSVASTNSDIMPKTRHDSRADQRRSASSGGIAFVSLSFSVIENP